ncbi:MAG: hypothetical protein H7Z39_01920 [Burkholderiaceae bacterium]|nr:hypothetical protein [Burkholderiaceae bacterium]
MLRYLAIGILAINAGCATLIESNQQEVLVQTIQDHRMLPGVGCVLANDAGRWFVNAPGRVTIQKSSTPLLVDCKKAGAGWGSESFEPAFGSVQWANIATGGLGFIVDHNSGAGFDYPATLTIVLRKFGELAPAPAPARKPVNFGRDMTDPAGP